MRSPKIDRHEEEHPHHVNEVPVPSGKFEAQMLLWREVAIVDAQQANGEEDRADNDVEAMEARRHEEGRAVNITSKAEGGVGVFVSLNAGEADGENNGQPERLLYAVAIIVQQGMMRPSDGG